VPRTLGEVLAFVRALELEGSDVRIAQLRLDRSEQSLEAVTLAVGDTLELVAPSISDLKTPQRVADDGTVLLPEAGWVQVAGLTRPEAELVLGQALAPYYQSSDIQAMRVSVGTAPEPGPAVGSRGWSFQCELLYPEQAVD